MENWSKQARVAEHYLELAQNKKKVFEEYYTHTLTIEEIKQNYT